MRARCFDLARALLLAAALTALAGCDIFDDDDVRLPPPGTGQVCAGFAGIACPNDLFCDLAPGECNTDDITGVCVPADAVCTAEFVPVCGCDGVPYGHDCVRRSARVAKDHDGPCEDA